MKRERKRKRRDKGREKRKKKRKEAGYQLQFCRQQVVVQRGQKALDPTPINATLCLIVNTSPPTYLEKRSAGLACKSGWCGFFFYPPPPPNIFAYFATAGVTITYQCLASIIPNSDPLTNPGSAPGAPPKRLLNSFFSTLPPPPPPPTKGPFVLFEESIDILCFGTLSVTPTTTTIIILSPQNWTIINIWLSRQNIWINCKYVDWDSQTLFD